MPTRPIKALKAMINYDENLKKLAGRNIRSAVLTMIIQLGVYYDVISSEWKIKRTNAVIDDPVSSIQARIIKYLRANYPSLQDKGLISAELLKEAEKCPELTITPMWVSHQRAYFCGENSDETDDARASRITGKALVAAWLSDTGQSLPTNLGKWIRCHPFLVKRIYDLVSVCGLIYAGIQRIGENVHRTVFFLHTAAQLKLMELRSRRRVHTSDIHGSDDCLHISHKEGDGELELPMRSVISPILPT